LHFLPAALAAGKKMQKHHCASVMNLRRVGITRFGQESRRNLSWYSGASRLLTGAAEFTNLFHFGSGGGWMKSGPNTMTGCVGTRQEGCHQSYREHRRNAVHG
jgi:hypothetical protein